MLKVEGLEAGYGAIHVLRGISFDVHAGEIVTLIGANGAGKTTTLMTLCGIVRARAGKVQFCGEDIRTLASHAIVRRGMIQAPEGRKIFPRLTVLENLELGAYLRRDLDGIKRDVERVLAAFPILGKRRPQAGGTLSGGEQQMLAIGRAMMARPKLLLLDEPSLGLAPLVVKQIFDVIVELASQGVTILLVEQNARMALSIATRGYVMETGQLTRSAPAADLLADPGVRAAYLGDSEIEFDREGGT